MNEMKRYSKRAQRGYDIFQILYRGGAELFTSGKQLLQYLQGAELGERGNMEAVKVVQHLQTMHALMAIEGEKMHGAEVHAHEAGNECSLLGTKIVPMLRRTMTETSTQEVKTIARHIIVEIGIEPQETGQAHEEDKMKIGHSTSLASIEPTDGVEQVGEERTVHPLLAQGMMKKFAQKQSNGRLERVERKGVQRMEQAGLGNAAQLGRVFPFGLQFEQSQRMKQGGTNTTPSRARYFYNIRCTSDRFGIDVGNVRSVVVAQTIKHNGRGLFLHSSFSLIISGKATSFITKMQEFVLRT